MSTAVTINDSPEKDVRKIMSYPLYDELLALSQQDGNAKISENRLAMTLNSANEKQAEILYSLIHHHFLLESKDNQSKFLIPYDGRENDKNHTVTFQVINMPSTLKHILFIFMNRYK